MKSVKDKLTKILSKKHGVDQRIVRLIADYPIKFYKRVAGDNTDIRPVRIRYFAAFVPKKQYIDAYNDPENKIVGPLNSLSG